MAEDLAHALSTQLADAVSTAAPSVVQIQGPGRPASGLVYDDTVTLTTMKALGGEDQARVRCDDGRTLDAEVVGWDPTTTLAVLRVEGLAGTPIERSPGPPRVGHLALAVGRSWSNAVTASAGIVAVIGGPLRTGRRHAIEQVIRTTARMHAGFAGGALIDTAGRLLGIATAARIRGLGVVIPAAIVWKTAATLLEHGRVRRGYLGLVGQPVTLSSAQRTVVGRDQGLLVAGVTDGGPADAAGVLVGDLLLSFDERPVDSAEDLLDRLLENRVGHAARLEVLRGSAPTAITVTVGERPTG